MPRKKFSIKSRILSFKYAFKGLGLLFTAEHNTWIYLGFIAVVVPAGFLLHISAVEWMFVTICIGSVISAEVFNTIAERMADKISPEYDPEIGRIKDLGAAAVLIMAIASAIVGVIIFLPKILSLL
jgi:diacylglycerol kinase (ATP)